MSLAANQGLYDGSLAAGLLWGLVTNNLEFKVWLLRCMLVAGIHGRLRAVRHILFIQALPALVTLLLFVNF